MRDLVRSCNYCSDECTNKAIRDQIIKGIRDHDTVEQLLREQKLTLDKAISVCRAHESAKQQRADIKENGISRASVRQRTQEKITPAPCANKTKEDHMPNKKCG